MIINWIKSIFNKPPQIVERINIETIQLNDHITTYQSATEYLKDFKCKLHPEYVANKIPINNCNICWEYYSQRCKYRH